MGLQAIFANVGGFVGSCAGGGALRHKYSLDTAQLMLEREGYERIDGAPCRVYAAMLSYADLAKPQTGFTDSRDFAMYKANGETDYVSLIYGNGSYDQDCLVGRVEAWNANPDVPSFVRLDQFLARPEGQTVKELFDMQPRGPYNVFLKAGLQPGMR